MNDFKRLSIKSLDGNIYCDLCAWEAVLPFTDSKGIIVCDWCYNELKLGYASTKAAYNELKLITH